MPKVKISEAQFNLIDSKTRATLFLSCVGGGKSYSIVLKSILSALEGKRVLFISYSIANIRDNLVEIFRQVLQEMDLIEGDDYRIVTSPQVTITIKGTNVLLRTGLFPDKLRGPSVGMVVIDECREFPDKKILDICLGRLRQGDNLQFFLSTTTRGKDWIYDMIQDEGLLDIFDQDTRLVKNDYLTVIRTVIDEAPHLTEEYREDLRKQYSSSFSQQELYAMIIDNEGALINTDWFKVESIFTPLNKAVRFWDLAVTTKKTSDYSCGCLLNKTTDNKFEIRDIKRYKLSYPDLKKKIIKTAISDGPGVQLVLEESGQQRAIIDDLRREPMLSRFVIKGQRPTKDKITRALPWISQAEFGNVLIQNASFKKHFFDECSRFSYDNIGKSHDDMIDSVSGAYTMITKSTQVQFTKW